MRNCWIALFTTAFVLLGLPAWAAGPTCTTGDVALDAKKEIKILVAPKAELKLKNLLEELKLEDPHADGDPSKACELTPKDGTDLAKTFAEYKKAQPKLSSGNDVKLTAPEADGCWLFKGQKQSLRLIVEASTCAADKDSGAGPSPKPGTDSTAAASQDKKSVVLDKTGKATVKAIDVGSAAAITVDNAAGPADVPVNCKAGALAFSVVAPAGKTVELPMPAKLTNDGGSLECNDFKLNVTAQPKGPTSCTTNDLDPNSDRLRLRLQDFNCGGIKDGVQQLCLGGSGTFLGAVPELRERAVVDILVIVDQSFNATVDLDVAFERTLVAHIEGIKAEENALRGPGLRIAAERRVTLTGLGTLTLTFKRGKGTVDVINVQTVETQGASNPTTCEFPEQNKTISLTVKGHYHFSANMMVAYTHLQSRSYSRQTGDDGVTRIAQQDSGGIDYVLNVTAYPFGVDEERDFAAVGLLLGTSVASLGKRWYAGLEVSSPIGFGVSGGAALSIVSKLDQPLVAGQPFAGDEVPVHDQAEPTWYVGVNLQAVLFKNVFNAITGNDKKGGASQ